MSETKLVLVHPEPGATIYTGGRGNAFETGRPVPLPATHAEDLIADGHARAHEVTLAQKPRAEPEAPAAGATNAPPEDGRNPPVAPATGAEASGH